MPEIRRAKLQGVLPAAYAVRSYRLRSRLLALIYVAPVFLVFAVILWYPIFLGIKMSFFNIDFVKGNSFVGFDNYRIVLHDSLLKQVLYNTFYYMVLALLIGYVVPIVTAVIISELRWLGGFLRGVVYLPAILPAIAIYALWYWMFEPSGLLNTVLGYVHVSPLPFLSDERTAMPSLALMDTWLGFGGSTLIYLAALKSVPEELYESSEIDGAGVLRRIRHITIPGLRNVMLILLILQLIGTAQVFGGPFVMTQGGPANSTSTILYMIYQYAFVNFRFGPAAALGVLFFIVLVMLSAVFLWISKDRPSGSQGRRRKA